MRAFLFTGVFLLFSCGGEKRTIKIKGSDTEVNLVVKLAENFGETNPTFHVSISGGGSGLGIASLLNGQADMANSSRRINDEEMKLFKKRAIGLDTVIFAEDAIAIVVSSDLQLDSIAAEDLGKILSGSEDNWSFLTGKDMPINIYGRQSNSGTHDFVQKQLSIEFSREAKQMNGNAQIIEAVKADPSGIGYVGAGYVKHNMPGTNPIKVLRVSPTKTVAAISPFDSLAIKQKRYFFQRPLYQYIRATSADKVAAFIAFEKSDKGISIIKYAGYYPSY